MGKAVQASVRPAKPYWAIPPCSVRERHGIKPREINDDVIAAFIAAVREGSLHRNPNKLHRQVTLDMERGSSGAAGTRSSTVTVASFRGPPKRLDLVALAELHSSRNVDDYLSWAGGSDPFDPDARVRPLASGTLRLRRDQILRRCNGLGGLRHESAHPPFARGSRYAQQPQEHSAPAARHGGRRRKRFQSLACSRAASDRARVGQG